MKNKKTAQFIKWLPRFLAIVFTIFIFLFSLDAFSGNEPFSTKCLGFLIHNIPVYILIAFIIIAWKRKLLGGILFFILATLFLLMFDAYEEIIGFMILVFPLLLIGFLFVLSQKYQIASKK